jgi:N-acetylmuramoyl-L-alanine amidase
MRCSKKLPAMMAAIVLVIVAAILSFSVVNARGTPVQTSAEPQTPSPTPTPSNTELAKPPETHATPEFLVMIDPGHGGDDFGATLGEKVAEKDITLTVAKKLKSELQEKGIAARLLRDADVTVSIEQRAETTNAQHAAVYVALHAGTPGGGVRVYAPALASAPSSASNRFLLWDEAQAHYLARSRTLAHAVAAELQKKDLTVVDLSTPLRPLNSIAAAAIAVELAPQDERVQEILGQKFQGEVVAGITSALVQFRPQAERAE